MAVTVNTTYWLKGGDSTSPFSSTVKVNEKTGKVLTQTNPPHASDIEITKAQHDQYVANNEVAAKDSMVSAIVAKWANLESQKLSASPKLIALGFTQDEIDAIFGY